VKPTIGRIVHYVSYGTPAGEYGKECRAAIITEVDQAVENPQTIGLAVLNPAGMFFNRTVPHNENAAERPGGTWHWPERAEN
jgi:hypothetical protein